MVSAWQILTCCVFPGCTQSPSFSSLLLAEPLFYAGFQYNLSFKIVAFSAFPCSQNKSCDTALAREMTAGIVSSAPRKALQKEQTELPCSCLPFSPSSFFLFRMWMWCLEPQQPHLDHEPNLRMIVMCPGWWERKRKGTWVFPPRWRCAAAVQALGRLPLDFL